MKQILKVENVTAKFFDYYSLFNVNFEILENDRVNIYGDDYIYILRIIAGLETNYTGSIQFAGRDIKNIDFKNEISVGYIPQEPIFFSRKSVKYNLLYVMKIRNIKKQVCEQLITQISEEFDLTNVLDKKIKYLSDFEKVKVSLARLSFRHLDVLIIEDIFNSISQDELIDIISKLKFSCLICGSKKKLDETNFNKFIEIENGVARI